MIHPTNHHTNQGLDDDTRPEGTEGAEGKLATHPSEAQGPFEDELWEGILDHICMHILHISCIHCSLMDFLPSC